MQIADHQQNLLYLYDLPKEITTTTVIAEAFKKNANVALDTTAKPQIKRDFTKPFYTAIVSIRDPE